MALRRVVVFALALTMSSGAAAQRLKRGKSSSVPLPAPVTPTPAVPIDPPVSAPVPPPTPFTPPILSKAQVASIETAMKADLAMAAGYGLDCNPCYLGDLYGAILRVVFHDAGGQQSRLDGCVDLTYADNNGLQEITGQLQAVWKKVGGAAILSFADLTAIAAKVAVEMSSTISKLEDSDPEEVSDDTITAPLILPLRFGRKDALTCNDEGQFPGNSFTWAQSLEYFNAKFGLGETESVALMGAHALGRAEVKNSGVSDMGWTDFQSSFGNRYFTDMFDIQWRLSDDFDVFEAGDVMLLRADTEMVISPQSGCERWDAGPEQKEGVCPLNIPTLPVVKAFGGRGGTFLWWAQFEVAFTKMVEANNPGLYAAL